MTPDQSVSRTPDHALAGIRPRRVRLPFDPLGLVGLLLVLLAWWMASGLGWVEPLFLPPPGGVATAIAENFFTSDYLANYRLGSGGLFANLLYSASNVALALVIACAIGIAGGLMSARNRTLRSVIDPVMLTAGTIPILVTAPFFLIWFGTSRAAQVALIVVYASTILYLFAQRAARNLDPTYLAAGHVLGASPRRVFFDILLVGTFPEILGGIRIALAGAWGLEAFAELLGAPRGIGRVVQAMATNMDTETVVAAIVVLAAFAVLCDVLVVWASGYVSRWKSPSLR